MPQTQIRLARTPNINKVLAYLCSKYQLFSEADIIKLALSEKYNRELSEKEERVKKAWEILKVEGKKIGDKLLSKKGLKRKDVTEQQFYDLFLAPKK